MSRRPPLVPLSVLGVAAASLLLAACGGSSSPTSSTSSAATAANNGLDFAKCMREHGVKNFPNPEIGANGATSFHRLGPGAVTPQTMEAAQQACRRFQPGGGEPNLTPQEKVAREEAVQKFAKCMREHGVKIEASSASAGGNIRIGMHVGPGSGGPNPESPTFQAAQKDCEGLIPSTSKLGGPRVGGPGGSSTNTGHGGESSGTVPAQAAG